jgi:acetyltransferase-like isoleucine patch superfamily enzyme
MIIRRFLQAIKSEIAGLLESFVIFYPETRIGQKLREFYFRVKLRGNLGNNACISQNTFIYNGAKLKIGDSFSIGRNSILDPNDSFGIIIGPHVHIASGVFIRAANHDYSDPSTPFIHQGHLAKKILNEEKEEASIIIEGDVWVGANSIILTGTKIGYGSVVAAGSLVSGRFPPYSIIASNPARVIGSRKLMNFSKHYFKFP